MPHSNIQVNFLPELPKLQAHLTAKGWVYLGVTDDKTMLKYSRAGTTTRLPQDPGAENFVRDLNQALLEIALGEGGDWTVSVEVPESLRTTT